MMAASRKTGEFEGVAQEIDPDLADQGPVGPGPGEGLEVPLHRPVPQGVLQFPHYVLDQLSHVQVNQLHLPAAQAREGQEVVNELAHVPGVGPDDIQQPLAFGIQAVGIIFQENPGETVNGPQRRPEVMGDGIGKTFQFLVGRLQLGRATLDPLFQFFIELADFFFGPFPIGNVYAQLEDQGGAVAVGKRIVIGVIGPPPPVRPLPLLGFVGVQDRHDAGNLRREHYTRA